MRLIETREETEAEVTWQDQECINNFSKLNGRMDQLEEQFTAKKVCCTVVCVRGLRGAGPFQVY
jgi:hypothetical protein